MIFSSLFFNKGVLMREITKQTISDYINELRDYIDTKLDYRIQQIEASFQSLIISAIQAQKKALTFKTAIGVAIQTDDGKIFSAGNIENTSRSLDRHAEIITTEMALMAGYKKESLKVLVVNSTKYTDYACPTCAICRQWLWENTHPDLEIITINPKGSVVLVIPLRLTYPLPWPRKIYSRLREMEKCAE